MKRFNFILLSAGIALCLITLSTPAHAAGTKKIGEQCTKSDECITQKCAQSTLSNNAKFCVCDNENQCSTQYGVKNNETWSCEKEEKISHGLAYCKSSKQGAVGLVTDTANVDTKTPTQGSKQTETTTKATPPTSTVSIPGAEPYTEVTVKPGEVANIPWIAQYIRGAYSYGIRLAAIIAVIMLMIGGILMISAGMNSSYFNTGKSIVYSSIFGIILLASSYLILNTINPKLVTPAAISLDTIEGEELDFQNDYKEEAIVASSTTPPSGALEITESTKTTPVNCNKKPSKPSGIGNTKYLGQLDCHSTRERKLSDITHVVIHDGGRTSGIISWWKRLCAKGKTCVASHYSIERDGTIYQMLDEHKVAYHATNTKMNNASIGIDLQPSVSTTVTTTGCLKKCKAGTKKGYKDCGTKELAIQKCTPTFTNAQYISLNTLLISISIRTGVTLNNSHIHGHCAIAHSDPRNFDWTRVGLSNEKQQNISERAKRACLFYPNLSKTVAKKADEIF